LVKEFPLKKNWKIGGLNKVLKKIDDAGSTGSTARLPGSGGEEPAELMKTSNALEIQLQFHYYAKFLTHAKIKYAEL